MIINVNFEELEELKSKLDLENEKIDITSSLETTDDITFDDLKKELETEFSEAREKMDTSSLLVQMFKGNDGYSAYEIACANGFVGTEEEWLESLHGKDGDMQKSVYDSQGKNVDFYRYAEGLVEDLANKNHAHKADDVKFTDGDTLQKKYDNGDLGGNAEVDLSGYYTKKESDNKYQPKGSYASASHGHNADDVTFADGDTFQEKYDSGELRGEKGENGLYYDDYGDIETTPLNADLLNGRPSGYYTHPYNLLDNSDFRNPVNQRGATKYTGNQYTIDRWRACQSSTSHELTSKGIKVSGTSATMHSLQTSLLNPTQYVGKTLTLAVYISENNEPTDLQMGIFFGAKSNNQTAWGGLQKTITAGTTGLVVVSGVVSDMGDYACANPMIRSRNATGNYTVQWMALYEGSYTAENLPPYHPKGYAHELTECRRYLRLIYGYDRPAYVGGSSVVYLSFDFSDMNYPLSVNIGTVTQLRVYDNGAITACTLDKMGVHKGGISFTQNGYSGKSKVIDFYWSVDEYIIVSAEL